LEAHISRSGGHGNLKFWFWQFFVNFNKCAKYFLNLKRCRPGGGQAQMVLPKNTILLKPLYTYIVRIAQYEPDAPPVKPFFSKRTFVTGCIFWADFALKSRGFAKIGKTSGGVKV
jgi:hypothetical protein